MTELLSEEFWAGLARPRPPRPRPPAMPSEMFDDLRPGGDSPFLTATRVRRTGTPGRSDRPGAGSPAEAEAGAAPAAPDTATETGPVAETRDPVAGPDSSAGPDGSPGPDGSAGPVELSGPVGGLVRAVAAVRAQVPAELPGPQALVEASVLLAQVEQLRVVLLDRLADVDLRGLSVLAGAGSVSNWLAGQHTSIERGEVALARRLSRTPLVGQALREGSVTIATARKLAAAMATARRHLDRPDGLIDGADGEAVITNVIVNGVRQVVCQAHAGLDEHDPRLPALIASLGQIAARPDTQAARLEAALLVLAGHLEPHALTPAFDWLLDAVLPQQLEQRSTDGHDRRGFTLVRNNDGTGWRITDGELDDECGELLHTVLNAELAVDPDNPADTADYAALRAQGWNEGDPLPADTNGQAHDGCQDGPRSMRQRRHDALRNALRRLLDSGAAGLRDKVAPHLAVTVDLTTLQGEPGALPARGACGTSLPLSLVRRWSCDSALTRFIMSLGRKVLDSSHTARTLTGHERRAKHLETGGTCQGAGCIRGPGSRLIPHHATPWADSHRTSLTDTVLFCEQTHHQLHHGKTIRLKDGRYLNQNGWTNGPPG